MTDVVLPPLETPRRFLFDWVPEVIFHPRQAFTRIAEQTGAVWLTPVLILSLTALLLVVVAGPIKIHAAQSGQAALPAEFNYYTPEQQAQFQQAQASTSGPVFVYVFPAIAALVKVWVGWLLVGGLLHLVLTLIGGRGGTLSAMNIVAWAALPLALRDLVRAAALLISHRLISSPGLSGFAPQDGANLSLILLPFLGLIDFYLLWHFALLVLGVRAGSSLPRSKVFGGVLFTMLLILALQALVGFGVGRLGGLTIIRPFF